MAKVHVLPEVLAHKIAAGEIVERPASVVKELLENALDAESRKIVIEADNGGKTLIAIRDDGIGMSPADARTAFEHHATSKIATFEDLNSITTLGFRGEALPSIASISRLRLRTVERQSTDLTPLGTEIIYEGGTLRTDREISWPSGTEVVVEDLFLNVPARRKFLKSTPTELGHVTRQVMQYALAYPEVEFQFSHQQHPLLQATAVPSLQDRVYQIFGETFLENLVPIEFEKDGIKVRGFTSLPHEQRNNPNSQYLYVNRRMVRDRVLTHALRAAYQDLIPASAYPVVLLLVEIDPREVDVNVHPCKTEIRFRDSNPVHSAIYHAIEDALLRRKISLASLARTLPSEHLVLEDRQAAVARSVESYLERRTEAGRAFPGFPRRDLVPPPLAQVGHAPSRPLVPFARPPSQSDPHQDDAIPETAHLSPAPVALGQFVESFIVVTDRDGVMLVDQHVAHERILYDRALRSMASPSGCPVQRLLLPVTLRLDPQQTAVLGDTLEELNANGFEVEWFGDQTIVIKGLPAMAGDCDARGVLEEILNGFDSREHRGSEGTRGLRRLRERIAISLACRAAIKVNTTLSPDKMQWLLDELFRCENPYTCPHGRPIILRLGIEEVLRGFKRI